MGFNQEETKNVYDFLDVVGAACGKESTTACLGEEIEEIMKEDDVDICASPELDLNSGKPVFEDVDEFRDIQDNDLLDNSDDWGFKSTQETNRV